MPRPKKSADELLSETARFRLTLAERERLRTDAAAAGISETEFIRRCVVGQPITSVRTRTDPALVVALNRIGNNVNQLARAVHRGSDFQRYWQEVGDELRGVLHKALEGFEA